MNNKETHTKEKDATFSKKLVILYLQQLFHEATDATHYIRMPEILSYLEKRGVPADRRTVYSAVRILDFSGFEMAGIQEKGGYKYHHPSRLFDTNELKILVDAVAASKYLTDRKSKELITKIKSLGSTFDNEHLNRNVLLNKRVKSMNDKVLNNLDIIYAAISSNTQISFHYMKWTPQKKLDYVRKGETYFVSPFAVTLNDDNYYLISFDHKYQNLRHYRIDKMQSIKLTSEPREGIELFKNFDIADYSKKTFGMFSGKEQTIQLQCKNSMAGVFIDRFGKDVAIRPDFNNPNCFIARITVNVSPQFYAWLFGLGRDVKILSPDTVIDEYNAMLQKVIANYNEQPNFPSISAISAFHNFMTGGIFLLIFIIF